MSHEGPVSPTSHGPNYGDAPVSPKTEPPLNSLSRRPSLQLVPTPPQPTVYNSLTPRPSIATTSSSSPSDTAAQPSPAGGGPLSTHYVVPARPKPGRKPATDEPASKRKAQNRESQRAFRARKAAKLENMQKQVQTTESQHRDAMTKMQSELHEKEMRIKDLETQLARSREAEKRTASERDYWKEQCGQPPAPHLQLQIPSHSHFTMPNPFADKPDVHFPPQLPHSRQDSPTRASVTSFTGYHTPTAMEMGCGKCSLGGECTCMAELSRLSPSGNPFMAPVPLPRRSSAHSPMKGPEVRAVEIFSDREIDFTAAFAKRKRPSMGFITDASDGSRCGFCTDDSNCLCNDKTLHHQDSQQLGDGGGKRQSKSAVASGPGSCADCQSNPQQRAWCQRVAQLRGSGSDFLPSPTSRTSSVGSVLETLEPRISDASMIYAPNGHKSSLGCSETFKLLEGRMPMDPDKMEWIGNLRPISKDNPFMQPANKYSALEIDTAGIIATLGQTLQPIEPRPSDGENASLVRVAQEFQRTTQSPGPVSGSSVNMSTMAESIGAPMNYGSSISPPDSSWNNTGTW